MSQWLPIDNAPKDEWIDLWNGYRNVCCKWAIPDYDEPSIQEHQWCERAPDQYNLDEYWFALDPQPSHWMPLPADP